MISAGCIRTAIAAACASFFLGACSGPGERAAADSEEKPGKTVVYAVNYPLAYFAERIGGQHAEVKFPAPADVDPVFWKPGAEDIVAFQKADVILVNGAGYAKWLEYASLPPSKVVDTSVSFRDEYLQTTGVGTHSHGPGGEHSHAGIAFTTWLDLRRAAEQAASVRDALVAASPENAERFAGNFVSLEEDLLALDEELQLITSAARISLLASHPVYDYLAHRYRLHLTSVLWEPDTFPGENKWAELRRIQAQHPSRWMIWEGEPLQESVRRLREMDIGSVVFDPCGNRPAEGDFLSVMRNNVENMGTMFSR